MNLTELVARLRTAGGEAREAAAAATAAAGDLNARLEGLDRATARAREELAAAVRAASAAGEAEATGYEARLAALSAALDRCESEAAALVTAAEAAGRPLGDEARALEQRARVVGERAERVAAAVRQGAESQRAAVRSGLARLQASHEELAGALAAATAGLEALQAGAGAARTGTAEATGRAVEAVEGVRHRVTSAAEAAREKGREALSALGSGLEDHAATGVRNPLLREGRELEDALAGTIRPVLDDATAHVARDGLERARQALEEVGRRTEPQHRGLARLESDLPPARDTVRTCVDRSQRRLDMLGGEGS